MAMIDLTLNTDLARTILTGFIHSEISRGRLHTRSGWIVRRGRLGPVLLPGG